MGFALNFEELNEVLKNNPTYQKIKYFVETGTYKAQTTLMVSEHFEHVYTIEIFEPLYQYSKKLAEEKKVDNITFLLGDSLLMLSEIVPKVLSGAVYFIDAHISGSDSNWNGKNRVPILEELDIILSHKIGPSIFIIDDLRLWKQCVWDWAHITNMKIVQKFIEKGYEVDSFYESNDRFYVLTK
jgi:hypothetical protein